MALRKWCIWTFRLLLSGASSPQTAICSFCRLTASGGSVPADRQLINWYTWWQGDITGMIVVAAGMIAEARIGEAIGVTEARTTDRLEQAVRALELADLPAIDARAILDSASIDKKNRAGAVRCTLLRRIGEVARAEDGAWTHALPDALLDRLATV